MTPVGEVAGHAAGGPFTVAAPAALTFPLDDSALRPADPTSLTPVTPVHLTTSQTRQRTIGALGLEVPLNVLRALACFLAAGALAVAAAAWSIGWTGARGGDDLLGDPRRILPVTNLPDLGAVVDLPDAAALRRVAARVDGFVLHHEGTDGATFLVQDGATTYRHRPAPVVRPAERGERTSHRRQAPTLLGLLARI